MPLSWKDAAGREWPCKITLPIARQIMADLGIDLLAAYDNKSAILKRILAPGFEGTAILTNIMFRLAKSNDSSLASLTEEEMINNIDGDTLSRMDDALQEALADFSPARREFILKGMELGKKQMELGKARAIRGMDKVNMQAVAEGMGAKFDQEMKKEIDSLIGGDSFTNALPNSDLTEAAAK